MTKQEQETVTGWVFGFGPKNFPYDKLRPGLTPQHAILVPISSYRAARNAFARRLTSHYSCQYAANEEWLAETFPAGLVLLDDALAVRGD